MAIDIRATVSCSLGTLISGSISDDYIQGSGLVKTKGSVEISGTITPAIGTVVTFSYVKGGVTRSIPRKLRVMSSFADPFRRTTKVELGCKLTYLSDLQEPVKWDAFNDPENAGFDADDQRIVTLPIHASSVMTQCLTELGITASSSPLTNKFSIAEFDFGGGYVQVLGDLLVSESYCGYLDTSEVLQVFALDQDAGTGPVFTASDIVDLGPIGVGQLPGEAVTVSFSTLKLKQPDNSSNQEEENIERLNWEREETIGSPQLYYLKYTNQSTGNQQTIVYTGTESSVTTTIYKPIKYEGQTQDVVDTRTTINYGPSIKNLTSYATAILNNTTGVSFNNVQMELEKSIETFTYTAEGVQTGSDKLFFKDKASAIGQLALPFAFSNSDYVTLSFGLRLVGRILETYEQQGEYRKAVTEVYKWWPETLAGQQGVAESKETFTTSSEVVSYINSILPPDTNRPNQLALEGITTQTRTASLTDNQGRPLPAERTNQQNSKGGDPNNGWRTESNADLELAVGSATAQRRIEFSLPYAPDDTFSGPSGGPFTATASDASAKANRYGRVQNRLLLGNRSGINLQLAPDRLPTAPYSPLYVQASGLTALYRANGTSWAFDSNGIVCSVDALFWAAVGGTGTFWFPVAPGITTLPTTPAITDGTMTPTTVVLPYNETAVYEGRLRLGITVTKFDYSLTLLTELPALTLSIGPVVERTLSIEAPSVSIAIAADVPVVTSSIDVRVDAIDTLIEAPVPLVGSEIGNAVAAPSVSISIAADVPFVGSYILRVPVADIAVAAPLPQVGGQIGSAAQPPAATITVQAELPTLA